MYWPENDEQIDSEARLPSVFSVESPAVKIAEKQDFIAQVIDELAKQTFIKERTNSKSCLPSFCLVGNTFVEEISAQRNFVARGS